MQPLASQSKDGHHATARLSHSTKQTNNLATGRPCAKSTFPNSIPGEKAMEPYDSTFTGEV